MIRRLLLLLLLPLLACGDKDDGDDTAAGLCADAPVVTWDNFGEGFLTENCQSCHSADTADRHGAPEDVNFDTEEEALDQADRILARAATASPTMPPAGGTQEEDRTLLTLWLTCWETL
jgi:uncharacterized membrane protein